MLLSPQKVIFFQLINGKCSLSHSCFSKRESGNSLAVETIKTSFLEILTPKFFSYKLKICDSTSAITLGKGFCAAFYKSVFPISCFKHTNCRQRYRLMVTSASIVNFNTLRLLVILALLVTPSGIFKSEIGPIHYV